MQPPAPIAVIAARRLTGDQRVRRCAGLGLASGMR